MSSLIPHDYRYKISSPTPVDKEPIFFITPLMSSIYKINNIIMVNLYNDFILLSTTESKDNIYLKIKKVLENISLGQKDSNIRISIIR